MQQLAEGPPTFVGIDHGFSFPLRYFEAHGLQPDWPAFLDDFQRHWPTDEEHIYVDFVRDGIRGNGAARTGNTRWRRLSEEYTGRAKSVFHFDVPGSVAKSTHAGLPWLRFIRQRLGSVVHFWPFDGWDIPADRSAVAELYPSLWRRDFPPQDRTPDQHDAYCIAAWLGRADRDGMLPGYLNPDITPAEHAVAQVEGWILGVTGPRRSATQTRCASDQSEPDHAALTTSTLGCLYSLSRGNTSLANRLMLSTVSSCESEPAWPIISRLPIPPQCSQKSTI